MKVKTGPVPTHHRLSFKHRIGAPRPRWINPEFLLGRDPFEGARLSAPTPSVNVLGNDEYYELEVPLPGFRRQDITVQVADDVLTVKGQRSTESLSKSEYIRQEHDLDTIERSFDLTPVTDQERITATMQDGILRIRLYHIKNKQSGHRANRIGID